MINVLQINFTTEQINEINYGATYPDYYNAYMKTVWDGDVYEAWDKGLYDHVADVSVDDIDTAFVVMNRWNSVDEKLVRRYKPLHSMSVGEILLTNFPTQRYEQYAVAPVGFSPLKLKNAHIPLVTG